MIREATDGARSMDDVMRMLPARPSSRAFDDDDIEAAVRAVCACAAAPFFDDHVRSAHPMDFARWLAPIGLRPVVTRAPAVDSAGRPAVDLRIFARAPAPGDTLRLVFWNPDAAWVRAGLHTNDRLLAVNGRRATTWPEVQALLWTLRVGDSLRFDIVRDGVPRTVRLRASGYDAVTVRLEGVPDATAKQRGLRAAWDAGW